MDSLNSNRINLMLINSLLVFLLIFISINLLVFYLFYESGLLLIFYTIIKWGYKKKIDDYQDFI